MITYAMRSMPGDRPYNEDYIRMREENGTAVFVLADGLGGCGHGELASQTAVESVISRFSWDHDRNGFFEKVVEGAQNAVLAKQEAVPEAAKMSTTLVVLKLENGYAQWAHIGDSRMYHFRNEKVKSQTLDHSVPQMLVRMGEIKPDEIRHHPDRNRLLHTIGRKWEQKHYVVSEPVPVKPGDAFLLCSDGFWEYIEEKIMCRELKRAENTTEWLDAMMKIVEKNGKDSDMDNYTAICVGVE